MAKKTVTDDIVNSVINGDKKREDLIQEGYDADELQDAVADKFSAGGSTTVSTDAPTTSSGVPVISGNPITYSSSGKPNYASRYTAQIDSLSNQLLSRQPFSYDHTSDEAYQQYEKAYTRQGEIAMQDTLGQVAARTGGLASSYAGTAAQQQYNSYMSALADKIPELRQAAYNMYLNDETSKRNDLSMLLGLEQNDYARYQSELSNWYAQQELAAKYAAINGGGGGNGTGGKRVEPWTDGGEVMGAMVGLNTANALATQNKGNSSNVGNSTSPTTTPGAMTELGSFNSTNTYLNEALKKSAPNARNYLEGLVDQGVLTEEGAFNLWNEYVNHTPTTYKELVAKTGNKNLYSEDVFTRLKLAGQMPYSSYEEYVSAVWQTYRNQYLGSYRYANETNDRTTAVGNQYKLGAL